MAVVLGGINILLSVYSRYYEFTTVFHSIFDQAQLTSYSWHFSSRTMCLVSKYGRQYNMK